MSAMPMPLTIRQHKIVKEAMYVVDEQALYVGRIVGIGPRDDKMDDLKSVGKIALCEIVLRFDERRVDTFPQFAKLRVRRVILRNTRAATRVARVECAMARAVANRMAGYDDDYNILRDDADEIERRIDKFVESAAIAMFASGAEQARREADEDPVACREEYARAILVLGDLVRTLKPDARALLDMLFGCGFQFSEAAKQLGVDKQTAWRRLQRLLENLRRELHTHWVREAPCARNDVRIPPLLKTVR